MRRSQVPEKAIATLEKCLRIQPDLANAWVALGVARMKKGDQAEAKQALERALVIDEDNPYALRNLGAVLGNAGDYRAAVAFLQHARRENPIDPLTLYGLALFHYELGERDNADRYLKELSCPFGAPTGMKNFPILRDGAVIGTKVGFHGLTRPKRSFS